MTIQELHSICAMKGLVAVFSVMGRRPEIVVEVEQVDRFGRRKNGEAMALEITEKALERIEAAVRVPPPGVEKVCGTCRRHDEWTGACTNALSPNRADFTDEEDTCEAWEYDGK